MEDKKPSSSSFDETQSRDGSSRSSFNSAGVTSSALPRISGYEVISLLGAGGMGTVWRARQDGTRREVALKLLNERSFDGRGRARFVREVELACRLQHPDIARVYDTGIHEGIYYYAMELVEGHSLDRYVSDRRLGNRQVLALMRDVCHAVQHAHLKGVIHRDLKPSNILVTADGRPHVLDFGLAKPITAERNYEVSDERGVTKGTLSYMSPEQAAGRVDEVDTRSDVYSLGKILFRLLTGEPAHGVSGTDYDLLRRVAEDDVRRPRDIDRTIPADVESVMLKALDRDPQRRYATAGELARDLDNFLRGEPVSACPATVRYFLGKKIARHRPVVAFAMGCILALIAVAAVAYLRVAKARDIAEAERANARQEAARADAERVRAEKSAAEADAQRVRAQTSALEADAVNQFVQDFLDALNPRNSHGRGIDRALMDRADDMLSTRFARQPRVEASIRAALGRNMLALGQFAAAETQLKRALDLIMAGAGETSEPGPEALAVMQQLAEVYRERGNIAGAYTLSNRVVEILSRGTFGGSTVRSPTTWPLPAPSTRPAWATAQTLEAMNTLAYTLDDLGRPEDAEELCRQALLLSGNIAHPQDLDGRPPDTIALALVRTLGRLLRLSTDPARLAEAESWSRRLVSCWAARSKPADPESADDPETLEARHDLAAVYSARNRWDEAVNLFRSVVAAGPASLGANHPDLVIWQNDLAAALIQRGLPGDAVEAERICRAILPAATEVRGGEHLETVTLLLNLADALKRQGKRSGADLTYRQADSYASRAVDELTHATGSPNPQALRLLDALVVARSSLADWEGTERASRQALEIRRAVFGASHRQTLMNGSNLGRVLILAGKPADARAVLTQTLKTCESALPQGDVLTAEVKAAIERTPDLKEK